MVTLIHRALVCAILAVATTPLLAAEWIIASDYTSACMLKDLQQ